MATLIEILPTEHVLKSAKDSIQEYLDNPTEDARHKAIVFMQSGLQKLVTEEMGGFDKFMERLKQAKLGHEMAKHFEHKS